jgi:RNA polymerase sigma factor (sigma-70 family)
MVKTPASPVVQFLKKLVEDPRTKDCADHDLLARFIAQHDEAAFAALMRRYARTVIGVCRCVLPCEADAEDAFQATFLVLARKAGTIRQGRSLGSWLYGVAYRTALKARANAAGRRRLEAKAPVQAVSSSIDDLSWREVQAVLHEELNRLPEIHRAPLVLCFLESRTLDQAAGQLGCGKGALRGRLERARQLLQARLVRRGLGSMAFVAAWTLPGAVSALPSADLVLATAKAATTVAAGGAAASVVSAKVAALTQGVIRAMFISKVKTCASILAVTGALWIGVALLSRPVFSAPQTAANAKEEAGSQAPKPAAQQPQDKPGRLLFYRAGYLTLIGPDGKDEKQLTKDRDKYMTTNAWLSPDGKRVAWLFQVGNVPIEDVGMPYKVYVRGLDEPEPGTDMNIEGGFRDVTWSPDGSQVIVAECVSPADLKAGRAHKIINWLVNVKTKEKSALPLPDNHTVMDWSRDGKHFLTTAHGVEKGVPKSRLHLMNRDGTQAQTLTDVSQAAWGGRLSPDGRKVLCLFSPPQREKSGLFVLDIESRKSLRVEGQPLNGVILNYCYCWSPDGKRIAYAWHQVHEKGEANQETESHLVVADADGKNQVTIASEKAKSSDLFTLGCVDWR